MLKITDPDNVKVLQDLLRCSLCKKVFIEATTIDLCVHTFCNKCIQQKFEEDGVKSCPVCHTVVDGPNPIDHLRPNKNLRSLVRKIASGPLKKVEKVKQHTEKSLRGKGNNVQSDEKARKLCTALPQESSSKLPVAVDIKEAPLKMPEFAMNTSELKADSELIKAPTKKKRNTTRKARQYNIVETKGKQKIENAIGIDCAAPQSKAPLWFLLRPAEDKNGNGFPKLDKPSLRLKDYSTTVSSFQKYLKQKLNLEDESEVEILMCGKKLNPTMNLDDIKRLWLEFTLPKGADKQKTKWRVEQLSIELAYGRRMV